MSSFSGFLYRRSAESFIGSCDDVEMRSFDEGETRSDLYRVEGSRQKLSTLSHLPFQGVVIIGHVVRRLAQCHKRLRRMKTS